MKLILKNLKQVQYNVEMESEKNTIKDLKNEIEKLHGFDSNLIKLLHNGKVLEDAKTLEDYQIKEDNVIIMMNTKPKAKPNPNPQPTEQIKPPSPKKEEPPKKEEEQPKPYNSEQVNSLVDMGYEREKVEKALNASKGNVELAIEFLTSGVIPEPSSNNPQIHPPSQPSNNTGNNLPPELRMYCSLIKVVCHDQPEKIFDLLNNMQQKNPALMNQIRQKEAEFKNLLIAPINQEDINNVKTLEEDIRGLSGQGGGRRAIRINLTAEEREAVNRLKALGDFTESDILQAYIACDKNEELAANYLFEQKLRDEEEAQNNNNNNQGQ